jgi:hypothetical protein
MSCAPTIRASIQGRRCCDTTLLADMLGQQAADETARILEYQRAWRANRDGFAAVFAAK